MNSEGDIIKIRPVPEFNEGVFTAEDALKMFKHEAEKLSVEHRKHVKNLTTEIRELELKLSHWKSYAEIHHSKGVRLEIENQDLAQKLKAAGVI